MVLEVVESGWIVGPDDDPADPCSHGKIQFEAGGVTFLRPEDGSFTTIIAGLFLMRTLEQGHTPNASVAETNVLFLCCGHLIYHDPNSRFGLICSGCDNGVDVDIVHEGDQVRLSNKAGIAVVLMDGWRRAVEHFCRGVQAPYDRSAPKQDAIDFEQEGWELFWKEWRARMARFEVAP